MDARHPAGRQRACRRRAIRSTRATARTTATSIRSGRTAATSPISTAACSSSTSPTRRTRSTISSVDQLAALYRLHAHGGAAVRPRADAGDRRVDREQRQGLAEADLDPRRPRGDQPGADRHLPAAGPHRPTRQAAGSAPTTSTRTCRCRPAGSPTRSCSAPSSTAACAPTTSPIRTSRRKIGVFVPPAPPLAPTGTIQLNDVFVDEREIVYTRRPPRRRALHPGDGFLIGHALRATERCTRERKPVLLPLPGSRVGCRVRYGLAMRSSPPHPNPSPIGGGSAPTLRRVRDRL